MKTILFVLPDIADTTFMLVGEYLAERGFIVKTCDYNYLSFRQSILQGDIDCTFINYSDDNTFDEITCFSKVTHPENQFIAKLVSLPPDFSSLIQMNASAYFSDCFTFQEMLSCLNTLEKGKKFISSEVKKWITQHTVVAKNDVPDLNLSSLTQTEKKILIKLASGNRVSEIADELFISVNTLNNHKTNIRKKLKLKSNRDLIVKAMELKYSKTT